LFELGRDRDGLIEFAGLGGGAAARHVLHRRDGGFACARHVT